MTAFHVYRPHRADPELLEKITVGREPILQEILERLARWTPGASRQHDLFIGPRGIGKTHLLQLVEHRLRTQPELSEKWVPLRMAEEFYGAQRVSDLLLEALRLLTEEDVGAYLKKTYDDVRYDDDDARVRDRCLDAFRGFHRKTRRGVLLMIENLDRVLEHQVKRKTELQQLRRILIEEDWIVVLSTSPTYLSAISKPEAPFFEFFRVRTLAEMTPEEQASMMRRLADAEQSEELDVYLKKFHSRLRALYHFIGGNPRLTVMLFGLVARHELGGVKSELDLLLDQLTPFYQDRMKEISDQEAKVLETMALLPEGATPTELAQEARLDAKVVRATMTRLERAGYVRREERREKRTVYIIPERLFRIWHQMNHSRSARGRIQFLLEFFASWYETREQRDHAWSELTATFDAGLDRDDLVDDVHEYMDYVVAISQGGERLRRAFDRLRSLIEFRKMDKIDREIKKLDQEMAEEPDFHSQRSFFMGYVVRHLRETDTVDPLLSLLSDEVSATRGMAATALGSLDAVESVGPLIEALNDKAPDVRGSAATALGRLNAAEAAGPLIETLSDKAPNVRGSAAAALGRLNAVEAVVPLIEALNDKAPDVRGSAAWALGRLNAVGAVEPLIEALSDKASNVRGSAARALGRLDLDQVRTHIDAITERIFGRKRRLRFTIHSFLRSVVLQDRPASARELLSAFREKVASPEMLRPYEIACDYLESGRDPAFLERQHPEMREAVLLLVGEDEDRD